MTLQQALKAAHLTNETSWAQGGFYSPEEIAAQIDSYGVQEQVNQLVSGIVPFVDSNRAHELLHCFYVGFKAADLVTQIASDGNAMQKLGVKNDLTKDHIRAALYAGILHDAQLAFAQDKIALATPVEDIKQFVHPDDHHHVKNPQYMRDRVDDDLRGAVMLSQLSTLIPDRIQQMVVDELLLTARVKTVGSPKNLLGLLNAHATADRACYHTMNFPLRGHAEGDALVGDRVRLYKQGQVSEDVVLEGVRDWLIPYTTIESEWVQRETEIDAAYLDEKIEQKAGGPLITTVKGTQTYEWIMDGEFVGKGIGMRTVRTPAFWNGVDKGIEAVDLFASEFPTHTAEIEKLRQNYQEIEQYRGM